MRTKYLVATIALIAISFTIGLGINMSIPTTSPTVAAGGQEHGAVTIQVQRCLSYDSVNKICTSYGPQEVVAHGHNLITNWGLSMIQNATNGTVVQLNLTNLTVGGNTSAIGITDTNLANIYSGSGLAPISATYTIVGIGNQTLNTQWTASAVAVVNLTGIYNTSAGSGHLFAEAGWTPTTTLQNGDKLKSNSYYY